MGCGSGKEVAFTCDNGCDAIGIDFSVEAINLARNLYPHLWNRFYIEDFYNTVHFKDGKFNGIVANAALIHLFERNNDQNDMECLMNQFNKRLKINGRLYLRVIEKHGKNEEYDSHLFDTTRWYIYYTMNELERLGEACGFNVVRKSQIPHAQYSNVFWNNILFEKM